MNVKQTVLRALLDAKDRVVSGEEIAVRAGVSRVAVNKAVQSLNKSGFEIESMVSSGYRLVFAPHFLEKDYVEASLPEGVALHFYDEIDSTNNEAKRLLSSGIKAPFAVVSAKQTGGRGRRGRVFTSPEGGVYVSTVLPVSTLSSTELVTTGAALAVAKLLESVTGEECAIKWVNDVYYRGRKAVGILTEGVVNMELGQIEEVIVGIGINYEVESFPPELADIAISLYPEKNAPLSASVLAGLEVKTLIETLNSDFLSEYRRRCFVIGKDIYVLRGDSKREAKALDVDENAHLVVEYENGEIEHLSSGEVTIRVAR
jgi:birA, biotin-[acetyl-CoA-carboxylase] ligase region